MCGRRSSWLPANELWLVRAYGVRPDYERWREVRGAWMPVRRRGGEVRTTEQQAGSVRCEGRFAWRALSYRRGGDDRRRAGNPARGMPLVRLPE